MKDMGIDFFEYGKRISLEIGIPIQLKMEGVAFPLQSVLVGMEIDEYLIIKIPAQYTNVKHKLTTGVDIIVRYLYRGTVYGFQTKLIEIITKPVKLLFLEYPKIIEHYDLRSQKRAESIFPATITIKDKTNHGAIIDVSKNGCRCHILNSRREPLPPVQIDDEILLKCKFPGVQGDREVFGRIKNIRRSRKELILGVEFSKLELEIHDLISQYIYAVEDFSQAPLK